MNYVLDYYDDGPRPQHRRRTVAPPSDSLARSAALLRQNWDITRR